MAEIADERCRAAETVSQEGAKARSGSWTCRTARRCSATCARWTRSSRCWTVSPCGRSARDLEARARALVADRDHVERRLERMSKQAKSGDAMLKKKWRRSSACSPTSTKERRAGCAEELSPSSIRSRPSC